MLKLLGTAAALVIAVSALASAGQPASATTVVDSRTATITIWHPYVAGSAEEQAFDTILASVRPRFPHVTFRVVRHPFSEVYGRFAADPAHGPDAMTVPNDRLGSEAAAGLLRNVTTSMQPRAASLTPQARASVRLSGRYYAIPESTKVLGLYYTAALPGATPSATPAPTATAASTATPSATPAPAVPAQLATTDALLTAVRGGLNVGFVTDAYFVVGFFPAFGGRIVDPTYRCIADRTPGVADALRYLRQLVLAGASAYTIDRYEAMQRDFANRTLDAVIDGNWQGGDYRDVLGADLRLAPIPAGPAGIARPYVNADGWFVNIKRPNQALATKIALAMSDTSAQKVGMTVAVHVPADATIPVTDPLVAGFSALTKTANIRPLNPAFDAFWIPFRTAIEKVVLKGADATAEVHTACSAMNAANGK
jgi:maltose-binding protein MalE